MRSLPRDRTGSDRTIWDYLPDPIWTGIFLLIPTAWLAAARVLKWWLS